ncbi:PE-PPE domain-containing protein [Mycolicibacterium hippocampi]|uniref:PE-PPE domain-containing protein n=1 Tax=Mycolicibacterium hippocampi TaxID=659824 RepID=A0A850PFH5_9MYCO|nr:hypothetical protein [Mycolicibacterium hippocampi]
MNRLKKGAVTVAALPMVLAGPLLAGPPTIAEAATGTLVGLFGSAPKFSSVNNSGSSVCPCRNIAYDFWPGQAGIADGVSALDHWIDTTWGYKSVVAFSKGTHSVLGWIRENADDRDAHSVRFLLLGSPETPGNNYPYEGHKGGSGLPETGDYDNVTFVVRQYDGVADAPWDKFNLLALLNASFSTHLSGYDELDLDNPDAVFVDPVTGASTLYFRTDVLPILAPIDWLTTDETMAQLDALLRPLIEAAYRRPVTIPDASAPLSVQATTVFSSSTVISEIPEGETVATPAPDDTTASDTAAHLPPSGGASDNTVRELSNAVSESDSAAEGEPAADPSKTDLNVEPVTGPALTQELPEVKDEEGEDFAPPEDSYSDGSETSEKPQAEAGSDTPQAAPSDSYSPPKDSDSGAGSAPPRTLHPKHRAPLNGSKIDSARSAGRSADGPGSSQSNADASQSTD